MINEKTKKRERQRSIALSDDIVNEIKEVTKGCISVSAFIRLAVTNELEKFRGKR